MNYKVYIVGIRNLVTIVFAIFFIYNMRNFVCILIYNVQSQYNPKSEDGDTPIGDDDLITNVFKILFAIYNIFLFFIISKKNHFILDIVLLFLNLYAAFMILEADHNFRMFIVNKLGLQTYKEVLALNCKELNEKLWPKVDCFLYRKMCFVAFWFFICVLILYGNIVKMYDLYQKFSLFSIDYWYNFGFYSNEISLEKPLKFFKNWYFFDLFIDNVVILNYIVINKDFI